MKPYYDADGVTIYQGDNRAIMPELPAGGIDLVFTSPPYNLGNTTGGACYDGRKTSAMQHGVGKKLGHYATAAPVGARGGNGKWQSPSLARGYGEYDDAMPHEEYVAWQHATLNALWPLLSRTGAIYYNHKPRILDGRLIPPLDYVPPGLLPFVRQEVIWKRSGGINFSPAFYLPTHERIIIIAKPDFRLRSQGASGIGDVWEVTQETNSDHPAPFPLGLPLRAIETTTARTILDPYAGSGTTLLSAKMCGRRAIGIELSATYCDMAVQRLGQAVLPLATA